MAGHHKFSGGKYSWGMCDICGIRTPYRTMKGTTVRGHNTGLRTCPTCWDPDHPQNFLPYYITVDAQALRDCRPDTGLEQSRKMYPPGNWPPYPPPPAEARPSFQFRADEKGVTL